MRDVRMPSILLLSERGDPAQLTRDLSVLGSCELMSLRDFGSAVITPRLIVTLVEMTDLAAFVRLRHALQSHRDLRAPLVCLVSDLSQQAMARAHTLGAREVLPISLPRPTLIERISHLLPGKRRQANPVLERGVSAAGMSLSSMMNAAAFDQSEVTKHLEVGASAILSTIEQADIGNWLKVVWKHDDATHQHCLLVAGLAAALSVKLGFSGTDRRRLTRAALLHDIGKAKVPPEILNKPGPLTDQELTLMRSHAVAGHRILIQQGGFDSEALSVVRNHHEYLDGSGYPDGLKGSKISDMVRLTTICDVYAGLIERRPAKPPLSPEDAYAQLCAMRGKLDADLVKAFRNVAFAGGETKTEAA
jgi:putative nucleotidyltransferase with HDIG domain